MFVLLGMLGLVFLAMKAANLGGVGGSDTYAVTGALRQHRRPEGARAGAQRGVSPWAASRKIALDPKTFQGVVTMEIERTFQFPKDSAAKILTAGLLGDQYVGMEPGGDDKNLAAGETVAQTQSAVVLENLIGQFMTGKAAEGAAPAAAAASGAGK